MVKTLLVLTTVLLSGCVAAPLVLTGVGAASVAVNETTGKTVSDHIVSGVNGQDCRLSRAGKEDVCQDPIKQTFKFTVTDVKPSTVAEIEAKYR